MCTGRERAGEGHGATKSTPGVSRPAETLGGPSNWLRGVSDDEFEERFLECRLNVGQRTAVDRRVTITIAGLVSGL